MFLEAFIGLHKHSYHYSCLYLSIVAINKVDRLVENEKVLRKQQSQCLAVACYNIIKATQQVRQKKQYCMLAACCLINLSLN